MVIKKRNFFLTLSFLLLTILMNLFLIIENENLSLFSLGWISIGSFILCFIFYFWQTRMLVNAYIIFLIMFYLFHFGLVFLIALSINHKYIGFYLSDISASIIAVKLAILSMLYMNFGVLLYGTLPKKYVKRNKKSILKNDVQKHAVYICLCIFLIPFLFYLKNIFVAIFSGYSVLYDEDMIGNSGILKSLSNYFIPSLLWLYFLLTDSKKSKYCLILLLIIAMLISLSGSRTNGFGLLLTTILAYWMKYGRELTKKSKKRILKILLILLVVLPVSGNLISLNRMGLSTKKNDSNMLLDPIINFFAECGGSVSIISKEYEITPSLYSYLHGKSYLYSILTMFPTKLDPTGTIQKMNDENGLEYKLTKFYNPTMDYGLGYSLVAEIYKNFGVNGYFFAIILGIVFGFAFSMEKRELYTVSIYRKFFVVYMLYSNSTLPRRAFSHFCKSIMTFILLSLLVFLIYKLIEPFITCSKRSVLHLQKQDFIGEENK